VGGAFGLKLYKGNTWWGYGHDPAYDTDSHVLAGTDWHFLCLTYDQSTTRIYVDGALRGERAMALNTRGARLFVGVRADQTTRNTFHGRIDEQMLLFHILQG
jgi:hypothetical protein